jgi:Xaa-Pro aminopeptidase
MEAEAYIFLDCEKLEIRISGVTQCDYDDLPSFLRRTKTKIFYNPANTNVLLSEAIPEKQEFEPAEEIIPLLKAVKSEIEIKNIKNAFVKDSVVVTKLLFWIHTQMEKDAPLTEGEIAIKLKSLRQEQPHYLCDSFKTIAAYGANAAQAHYNTAYPGEPLKPQGFLLIDTGGQYLDGTTDSTRTIPVGPLSDEMKRDFTLVLKGHINLARAQFLKGTTGHALDILARQPLWQHGQNYRSGTGHGIGYCLGVHEGPHNIGTLANNVALVPGMLVTNEPGIYKEGRHGIRTENVLLVRELFQNDDGTFLGFEPLMYCPIALEAIDTSLLYDWEIEYLNAYHKKTFETLSPFLDENERAWLRNATAEISSR